MRSPSRFALPVASAALLLLAACGSAARTGGGAGPTTAPSTDAAGCPTQLTITAADNGRTACVAVGGTVLVTSPSAQAKAWIGLDATGALTPVHAAPSLAAGTALIGAYEAMSPGTATLNAGYRNCPQQSGQVSCLSIIQWSATVQVK